MEMKIRKEINNGTLNKLIDQYLINSKEKLIIDFNNVKYEIASTNKNEENKSTSTVIG